MYTVHIHMHAMVSIHFWSSHCHLSVYGVSSHYPALTDRLKVVAEEVNEKLM